ncbi:MAG: exodeoxyribonuclease VII large subunit [Dongiaceae bacterium]
MSVLPSPNNIPEFSVSEISGAVKRVIEGSFERVRVRGEVSKVTLHSSGHLYFTIKDEGAVLDAVCWRGNAGRLKVKPETGLEVIVTGKISTYGGQSKYQLIVELVEAAGIGALLKLLEERRKKLAAEGLFDAARKKPLPFLPKLIGVITSPTGVVIRDILHRLEERFPVNVIVWPVAVQGDAAAGQIVAALDGFNALTKRPDVLIVARGGGSVEDLWCFNEEIVVRAVARSEIPVISAVGHETDTTLIDFAADRRAPTPTAAAEIAVPVRAELLAALGHQQHRLQNSMMRALQHPRERLAILSRSLVEPRQYLNNLQQRLDHMLEIMTGAARNILAKSQQRFLRQANITPLIQNYVKHAAQELRHQSALLESFSYTHTLARGFALVRDNGGKPVTSAKKAKAGQDISIQLQDGEIAAKVK